MSESLIIILKVWKNKTNINILISGERNKVDAGLQ